MASYTYSEHYSGCKCCRLEHGEDLPIPKTLSYDDISALATKFSHGIYVDWIQLNAILKRFEGVIQKRWLKKGLKQRREILLKACPDMPADHRPDFASFRDMRNRMAPRSRTCVAAAHLWPYINLEDLQKHHLLLLFLNARGRNLPKVFMDNDVRSAHLGKGWEFTDERSKGPTEESRSMHFLPDSPRTYGRLVLDTERSFYKEFIAKDFTALDVVALWDQHVHYHHPAVGLLALEIQQRTYSFLLSCAKSILHDIAPEDFLLAPFVATPAPLGSPARDWPSLAGHQLEATYRVPQKLDLDRVRMLVASRRASAEDHIWLLKEDPAYFASTYEDWAAHDYNMCFQPSSDDIQRVVALMVSDAIASFVLWDYIDRNFETVSTPDKDQCTWAALLDILGEVQMAALLELTTIEFAPRSRHIWATLNLPDRLRKNQNRDSLKESERRVLTLFSNLIDPDKRHAHTLHEIVEETQYMLDTDAEANRFVDSWIIGHFSDLALATELQFRLEGLRPWASTWSTKSFQRVQEVRFFNAMLLGMVRLMEWSIFELCKNEKNLIGDPSNGRLNYPISKAYTKSNVEQLRYAEDRLDKFWQDLEAGVAKKNGLAIDEILHARFLEPRTLYRTQEWKTPILLPWKATILTDMSPNVPQFTRGGQTSAKVDVVKLKEKIKTRGVASSVIEEANGAVNSSEATNEPKAEKINVNKRTYKVLAALFPGPSAENHQRVEIAWSGFLHALDAIGLQPEKLYGSVWIFRPKKETLVEAKRSIQFHEPKEIRHGGKIPASMVRVFGRRLKRAYGWESGMFESK